MQSKSQSRLYQTKPPPEVEGEPTIAAVHPTTSDKVARMQPPASAAVSPARPAPPARSPHKSAVAMPKPQHSTEEALAVDRQVSMHVAAAVGRAAMHESSILKVLLDE